MSKLIKSAKSQPDPAATNDKLAVVAYMRGASSSKAPPEPPPNYNSMSDADLAKEWAKVGG
jgi:hypothetical protein